MEHKEFGIKMDATCVFGGSERNQNEFYQKLTEPNEKKSSIPVYMFSV